MTRASGQSQHRDTLLRHPSSGAAVSTPRAVAPRRHHPHRLVILRHRSGEDPLTAFDVENNARQIKKNRGANCVGLGIDLKLRHDLTCEGQQLENDWQPIETAPLDGTRILLVDGEHPTDMCTGWWTMAGWRDFGDIGCNGLADYSPTHWMQLPAPPRPLEARRASFASH